MTERDSPCSGTALTIDRIDASSLPVVVVLMHLCESTAAALDPVTAVVLRLATMLPDVWFVCSTNDAAAVADLHAPLAAMRNVVTVPVRPRDAFGCLLARASVVLTASAATGVAASSFRLSVTVAQAQTESWESVDDREDELTGTDPDRIVAATVRALRTSVRFDSAT